MLCSHLWPVRIYQFLPHYLINGQDFRENHVEPQTCVWISSIHLSEQFLISRRTERDMIISVYRSSCKVPVIFSGTDET